jgi:hypothetical protein
VGYLTTSANITTVSGDITFTNNVTIDGGAAVTIGSTDAVIDGNGDILFSQQLLGASATNLTITTVEDVTVAGLIGGPAGSPAPLGNLTINGKVITLNGIGTDAGTPAPGAGALALTATGTESIIVLQGRDYVTSGSQILTSLSGSPSSPLLHGHVLMGTFPTGSTPVTPPAAGGSWGSVNSADTISLVATNPADPAAAGTDLYIDMGAAVKFLSNISCRNFVSYRGELNLNAKTITTAGDFVVFGAAYNPADMDWPVSPNTRFDYYDEFGLLFYDPMRPVPALPIPTPITNTPPYIYSTSFADLRGAGIEVGRNFYVNGADMQDTGSSPPPAPATTWRLKVPKDTGWNPQFNGTELARQNMWGNTQYYHYAVAFNMQVSYSDAELPDANGSPTSGWIVAVETDPPEFNNNVTESVSGTTRHWQFNRPQIDKAEAVFDNLLKITMGDGQGNPMLVENSNDEIFKAISELSADPKTSLITTHSGARFFRDVYIEAPAGHSKHGLPFPENLIHSQDPDLIAMDPDGVLSDVSVFYLLSAHHTAGPDPVSQAPLLPVPAGTPSSEYIAHTWRTDATGASPGGTYSTDSGGRNSDTYGTTVPNIKMPKGRLSAALGGALSKAYIDSPSPPPAPPPAFPIYDGTEDKMAPVLHAIKVGRASHNKNSPAEYDAHNFFELRYSEPVDIGTDARFSASAHNAFNVQAETSFTDYGGGISATGTSVNVAGYFSYTGQPVTFYDFNTTNPSVKTLTPEKNTDGTKSYDSLYRPDEWRLRIFLSGYSSGGRWPGWHSGIPEPVTDPPPTPDVNVTPALQQSPVTLMENPDIKDASPAGNPFSSGAPAPAAPLGTNKFSPFDPADSNDIFYGAPDVTLTNFTGRWDVDPPAFSFTELPDSDAYVPGTHSAECEIIPVSLDGGLTVAKLDFFIQDNSRENDFATAVNSPLGAGVYEWDPFAGPPDMHPDNRYEGSSAPYRLGDNKPRGVRDTSLRAQSSYLEAFKVGVASSEPRVSSYNNGIDSMVTHKYFLQGLAYSPNPAADDPYFSLLLTNNPWRSDDAFVIEYDHTKAYITDLAGNLLPSAGTTTSLPLPAVDQIAPLVQISLAPVGENKVYIQFSEGLYHNFGTLRSPLSISDFILTNASVNIDTSIPLKILQTSRTASPIPGVVKGVLSLTGPLTEKDILTAQINFDPLVCDYRGNPFETPGRHAISDIALGLVDPAWISDGYRFDTKQDLGDSITTLKTPEDFTGKGRVRSADIIMEAKIKAPFISAPSIFNPDTAPLTLYYDADPKGVFGADEVFTKMWLPLGIEGVISSANTEARSVNAYNENGSLRNFLLPQADPENIAGSRIEFLYMLEAPDPVNPGAVRLMPAARYEPLRDYDHYAVDPGNLRPPFAVLPWSFQIAAPIVQRGGVSIYNNVINPNRGDRALLTYTLNKGGMVNVNIFSLDGSLVYAVHRGTQAAGTYNYFWNGKNMGGRPVARGIYFIRVLGPNVDEIRKVMVIK